MAKPEKAKQRGKPSKKSNLLRTALAKITKPRKKNDALKKSIKAISKTTKSPKPCEKSRNKSGDKSPKGAQKLVKKTAIQAGLKKLTGRKYAKDGSDSKVVSKKSDVEAVVKTNVGDQEKDTLPLKRQTKNQKVIETKSSPDDLQSSYSKNKGLDILADDVDTKESLNISIDRNSKQNLKVTKESGTSEKQTDKINKNVQKSIKTQSSKPSKAFSSNEQSSSETDFGTKTFDSPKSKANDEASSATKRTAGTAKSALFPKVYVSPVKHLRTAETQVKSSPVKSTPKKTIVTPTKQKSSPNKNMNNQKDTPSKRAKPKLVKIRNIKGGDDIKEIKPVPKRRTRQSLGSPSSEVLPLSPKQQESGSRDTSDKPASNKSKNSPRSKKEIKTPNRESVKKESPGGVTKTNKNKDEKDRQNVSKDLKYTDDAKDEKRSRLRTPKKSTTDVYKSRHSIGRRSAGRVCSYKESEIAYLFPDDYQWTALKVGRRPSIESSKTVSEDGEESDNSDSDDSEVTFPNAANLKSLSPKKTRTQSVSPVRSSVKSKSSHKTSRSLDRSTQNLPKSKKTKQADIEGTNDNKSDKGEVKKVSNKKTEHDKPELKKVENNTTDESSEDENHESASKPKQNSPKKVKVKAAVVQRRRSKYEDIRPRAPRIQRTACLNANAINSLLYDNKTAEKFNKTVDKPDDADIKPTTEDQDLKKVNKNAPGKPGKSPSKEEKEKKDAKKVEKNETKSRKKKALKRKPSEPEVSLWPPPKRMASLNAQAIMAACKELDEIKPEKLPKSPKDVTPKEKKTKSRKSLENQTNSATTAKSISKSNSSDISPTHLGNEPQSVRFVATTMTSAVLTNQISPQISPQQQQQRRTSGSDSAKVHSPGDQYINVVDDGDSVQQTPLASPQSAANTSGSSNSDVHIIEKPPFAGQHAHANYQQMGMGHSFAPIAHHQSGASDLVRPKVTTPKPMPQYATNMQYSGMSQQPFAHGSGNFRPLYPTQVPVSHPNSASPAMSGSSYSSTPPSQQYPSPVGFDSAQMMYPRHSSPYKHSPHPSVQNVPAYPPSVGPYNKPGYDMSSVSTAHQRYDVSSQSLGVAESTTPVYTQAQTQVAMNSATDRSAPAQTGFQSVRPGASNTGFVPTSVSVTQTGPGPFMQPGGHAQNYQTGAPTGGYSTVMGYPKTAFQAGPAHQGAFMGSGYQVLPTGNQHSGNAPGVATTQGSQTGVVGNQRVQGPSQNLFMSYGYYQPAGPLIQTVGNPYLTMRLPQSQFKPFGQPLMTHATPLYAADKTNTSPKPNANANLSPKGSNNKHLAIAPKPTFMNMNTDLTNKGRTESGNHQSPSKSQPQAKPDVLDLTKDSEETVRTTAYPSVVVTSTQMELSTQIIPDKSKDVKRSSTSPQKETKDIMDLDSKKVKVHTGAVGEMERHSPLKIPRGHKSTSSGVPPKKPRLDTSPAKPPKTTKLDKTATTKTQAAPTTITSGAVPVASTQSLSVYDFGAPDKLQAKAMSKSYVSSVRFQQSSSGTKTQPKGSSTTTKSPPTTMAIDSSQIPAVPRPQMSPTQPTKSAVNSGQSAISKKDNVSKVATTASAPKEQKQPVTKNQNVSSTVTGNTTSASSLVTAGAIPTVPDAMRDLPVRMGAPPMAGMTARMPNVMIPEGIRPLVPVQFAARHVLPGQISMPRYHQRPMAVARPVASFSIQRMSKPDSPKAAPFQRKRASQSSEKGSAKSKSDSSSPANKKPMTDAQTLKTPQASPKSGAGKGGSVAKSQKDSSVQQGACLGSTLTEKGKGRGTSPKCSEKQGEEKKAKKAPKSPKPAESRSKSDSSDTDHSKSKSESTGKHSKPHSPRQKTELSKSKFDSPKSKFKQESPRQKADSPKSKTETLKALTSSSKGSVGSPKSGQSGAKHSPYSPKSGTSKAPPTAVRVGPGAKSPSLSVKNTPSSSRSLPTSGKTTPSSGGKKERRRSFDDRKFSPGGSGRRRLQSAPINSPPSCWKWEGLAELKNQNMPGDVSPVLRKCYPSIRHTDGDVIRVRDCVLVKSGSRKKDLPFVAKIASLWDRQGEMMMNIFWYYRPEQTDTDRIPKTEENEIFASRHRDVIPVACIDDKAYVLTFSEYCRYKTQQKRLREGLPPRIEVVPVLDDGKDPLPPLDAPADSVFLCRKVYDVKLRRFLKNPQINSCHSPMSSKAASTCSKSPSPKAPTPPSQLDLLGSAKQAVPMNRSGTMPSPMSPDVGVFMLHSANLPSFLNRGPIKVLKHDSAASNLDVVLPPENLLSQTSNEFVLRPDDDDKMDVDLAENAIETKPSSKRLNEDVVKSKPPSKDAGNVLFSIGGSGLSKGETIKIGNGVVKSELILQEKVSSTNACENVGQDTRVLYKYLSSVNDQESPDSQDTNNVVSSSQTENPQENKQDLSASILMKSKTSNGKALCNTQKSDTFKFVPMSSDHNSTNDEREEKLSPESTRTFETYKFVAKPPLIVARSGSPESKNTELTFDFHADIKGEQKSNASRSKSLSVIMTHSDAQLSTSGDQISKDMTNEYIANNDLQTSQRTQTSENPEVNIPSEETKMIAVEINQTLESSTGFRADSDSYDQMVGSLDDKADSVKANENEYAKSSADKKCPDLAEPISTMNVQSSKIKTVSVSFPKSPRKYCLDSPRKPGLDSPRKGASLKLESPRKSTKRFDLDISIDSDKTIIDGEMESSFVDMLNTSSSTDDSECREGDEPPEEIIRDMTIVEDGSGRIVTPQGEAHLKMGETSAFVKVQGVSKVIPKGDTKDSSIDSTDEVGASEIQKNTSSCSDKTSGIVSTVESTGHEPIAASLKESIEIQVDTEKPVESKSIAKSPAIEEGAKTTSLSKETSEEATKKSFLNAETLPDMDIDKSSVSKSGEPLEKSASRVCSSSNDSVERRPSSEDSVGSSGQFDAVIAKLTSLSKPTLSPVLETKSVDATTPVGLVKNIGLSFPTNGSGSTALPPFETLRTLGVSRSTSGPVDRTSPLPILAAPVSPMARSSPVCTESDNLEGLKKLAKSIEPAPSDVSSTSAADSTADSQGLIQPDSTSRPPDSTTGAEVVVTTSISPTAKLNSDENGGPGKVLGLLSASSEATATSPMSRIEKIVSQIKKTSGATSPK